jgi:hypothetical protein
MKFKLLLAAFLLCAASTFAQGKIQFDWQGDQNLFQASFQVNAADYALGWPFSPYNASPPALMQQTLTITTPDHVFGSPTLYFLFATETEPQFWHGVTLTFADGFPNWIALAPNGSVVAGKAPGIIAEHPPGGANVWQELGTWNISVVPEPSCAALLGLGVLALYMKRAASR